MPKKEITFTISLPIKSVWSFMIDRREVGCLFPGCKGVKILNDLDSVWTIKMSLGPFSRLIEMQAHTTEMVENERLSWNATGEHLITSGIVTFRKISNEETEITYHIEGHVTGHFTFLQDMVVSEKLGEVCRTFMKNIKARLEYSTNNENKKP
ncbi:MAG TPA: SRPBCC domain-containing protein [Nitrospirota bacterium]|nr:SRPBCC domain-containing protein [Nitrospirota bacterium]